MYTIYIFLRLLTTSGDDLTRESRTNVSQNPDLAMTHFAFNSAVLTAYGKRVLSKDAEQLQQDATLKVQVQGFCDDRGSAQYNLRLGERRAEAVKTYLKTLGISGERITTVSFGKAQPLITQDNEKAWAQNRRASFVIQSQNLAQR
jgi:peptidoglycan-associated lipoprotein